MFCNFCVFSVIQTSITGMIKTTAFNYCFGCEQYAEATKPPTCKQQWIHV